MSSEPSLLITAAPQPDTPKPDAERAKTLLIAKQICKTYMSPMAPMARFWTALFNRPPSGEIFEVLKQIDLEILAGETLGIMGRNGAGKSTLLGVLAGVLPATSGAVEHRCRIAVLLELGAGFDLNLTGRENARIYCGIMGMSGAEIDRKLPAIERFADIEEYFDMPARTYSSGMYARLAFAAAIHVDADLVIVDETLSVGDAAFRLKCFKAIEQRQADGVTFLMVSHNQNVIANFCTRAIVLEKGVKVFDGAPLEAVGVYKRIRQDAERRIEKSRNQVAQKALEKLAENDDEEAANDLVMRNIWHKLWATDDGAKRITIRSEFFANRAVEYPTYNLMIRNANGLLVGALETDRESDPIRAIAAGELFKLEVQLLNVLAPGSYFVDIAMWDAPPAPDTRRPIALYERCLRMDVIGDKRTHGLVDLEFCWREAQ